MTDRSRLPWHRVIFTLGVAGVLVLAGCTDEGSSSANGPSPDSAAVLGAKKPASGEPLTFGFVYDGTTDAIDSSDQLEAAEASVKYVNEYLGGVGGRPIELDVCSTDQNPAEAANCVTRFVTAKVPAVLSGTVGQAGSVFPALSKAGIPVFTSATLDRASLSGPGIFVMTNGLGYALAGPAKLAQQAGYDRAAIIVTDVPAASGAVKAAAPLFYGNAGVKPDVVPVPPDAADMTPQVQAELSNKPGQFHILGVPQFCARAIQAIRSVNFQGDTILTPQCIDSTTVETVGGLDGIKIITASTTDQNSEEYRLFAAVVDTYSPESELGGETPDGFQAIVGFARAVAGLNGEVTSETVANSLRSMPPTPMPLGDGVTFKCDGKQVPVAPNICSTQVLTGTLDENGEINGDGYSALDVSDLMKAGEAR